MRKSVKFTKPFMPCTAGALLLAASINTAIAETSGGEQVRALEEVIVTARKREESLQDTPVVISALTKKAIDDFSIESIEDISDFTPGLVADSQGLSSGGVIYLRGVGSPAGAATVDQAVSLVVDDMQVGSLQIQNTAMIDMQAVQVYKGPQALFFGKNSPGGILSIKTADPGDEFEAGLKTGYNFQSESWFVQGLVSSPFSDTAAGRLVVRYTENDGYFDIESDPFDEVFEDGKNKEESMFARGTLVLEPSDNLRIRTKLTYSEAEAPTSGTVQLNRVDCPLSTGPQNAVQSHPCEADDTLYVGPIPDAIINILDSVGFDIDEAGVYENEQLLATVAIDWDINDELTLSSVTGYYDIEHKEATGTFGLVPHAAVGAQDMKFDQITQEFRLASSFDGPVNFVTGIFYEDKTHDFFQPTAAFTGAPPPFPAIVVPINEYDQDTTSKSVFLDVTWDITDSLELSGGARYSEEEKSFDAITGYIIDPEDPKPTLNWYDTSPQLTLSYTPNDQWMFYASYREGFKSGGFDTAFKFSAVEIGFYEPEEVDGFEVGAKATLLDNTLQLNMAAFSYEYEELQLSSLDGATLSLQVVNAAGAEIKGFEMDVVWITPIDGLEARGAYTFLDSEFTDYDAPCYDGQSIIAGCNGNFSVAENKFLTQDLTGESLNYAAENVLTLGLNYQQPLGDYLLLGLSMDATYTDEYETNTERDPRSTQDSYTTVNAAVSLSGNDTWAVSLVGRNLSDEVTISNGSGAVGTGSGDGTDTVTQADLWAWVRPGRTFAVEFEYNF